MGLHHCQLIILKRVHNNLKWSQLHEEMETSVSVSMKLMKIGVLRIIENLYQIFGHNWDLLDKRMAIILKQYLRLATSCYLFDLFKEFVLESCTRKERNVNKF
jgi:hypothetical protein